MATDFAAGFAGAIDHGEDPHAVYARLIQQDNVPEDGWPIELYTARNDPATRKRFEFPSTVSLEQLKAGAPTHAGNAEVLARNYKLMNEIDRTLADRDPTFRKYLAASRGPMAGDGMMYIPRKRNEYWRAVTWKLKIWLADPALFTTCNLENRGVAVPK